MMDVKQPPPMFEVESRKEPPTAWGVKFLIMLIFVLLAYQLFFARKSGVKVGANAPTCKTVNVESQKSWKSPFQAKTTVLHFWATWCQVCVRTLRASSRRAEMLQKQGVQYLLINIDDPISQEGLERFLRRRGISKSMWSTHYRDAYRQCASRYRIRVLPSLFVIDQKGKIAAYGAGYVSDQKLSQWIKKLKS